MVVWGKQKAEFIKNAICEPKLREIMVLFWEEIFKTDAKLAHTKKEIY